MAKLEKKNQVFSDEEVDFVAPSGIKVMKTEPPSREACERFIAMTEELKAKYNI